MTHVFVIGIAKKGSAYWASVANESNQDVVTRLICLAGTNHPVF
jgi:hypothetical protein